MLCTSWADEQATAKVLFQLTQAAARGKPSAARTSQHFVASGDHPEPLPQSTFELSMVQLHAFRTWRQLRLLWEEGGGEVSCALDMTQFRDTELRTKFQALGTLGAGQQLQDY